MIRRPAPQRGRPPEGAGETGIRPRRPRIPRCPSKPRQDVMHGRSDAPIRGPAFLADGGAMGVLLGAHDWDSTPLGAPLAWAESLKTLVAVMFGANQPMFIVWGPERRLLYNDLYAQILGGRHPAALGRDYLEVWGAIG